MRKIFKLLGFLSAILCLFFVVAILAFYYLTRVGELRRYLVDEIEKQTELKAQVGGADIEIGWITGVVFQNVALTEADAAQPAITAARVTARVALRPLLRRQVIFYEIRLTRPTLRLVRDPAGRFPLLDKLLNLPFLKQQNSEFSFDLHSLKVDGGDFEVTDQAPSGGEKKWRLVDAKLELDHVRGQRLRDFFQSLFKQQPAESGAGLEFDLKSAVIKDGSKMNLNARGYLVFPRATFDLREARWNADLELVNFPATLVKDYVSARVPIKHMSGLLAQHLRVQGSPAEQLHINGDVEFRQLAVDAPELFLAPLAGADGRVSFDVDWSERLLQIRHADFRANDLKFSLQGNISALDGNDPRLRLNLGLLSAPVAALRRYLPIKIVESRATGKDPRFDPSRTIGGEEGRHRCDVEPASTVGADRTGPTSLVRRRAARPRRRAADGERAHASRRQWLAQFGRMAFSPSRISKPLTAMRAGATSMERMICRRRTPVN